jgi:isopentenyl phosphate kinase
MPPVNVQQLSSNNLQFIKLGGSLITDKTQPHTPRLEVIQRLASEIAAARRETAELQLVLGHGSGSFGHVPASNYHTRHGVSTAEDWYGFYEVWREAQALNRIVMDALANSGVPAISLPPIASVIAEDGRVSRWDVAPLQYALMAGLVPVVYGDVVFDLQRGGTILSTEDLFEYLARQLHPQRVLIAGIETGVWRDFPLRNQLVEEITPASFPGVLPVLRGSTATDVTGGMESKVRRCLELVEAVPMLEILIFSGDQPDTLKMAIYGHAEGTRIVTG